MAKIIMCKGLPASGKSTWAKEMIGITPKSMKRVNRDELRLMIDGGKWSKENEKMIIAVRDNIIRTYINKGYDVIIDDTNLAPKTQAEIAFLAKELDVEVEVKDFTHISFYDCIERDKLRGDKSVGADVIMRMYRNYLEPLKEEDNQDLPCAIIVDVDGTLAKMSNRSPFDWDKIGDDTVHEDIARIVRNYDGDVIVVSGRDEVCRDATIAWLHKYSIRFDKLYMRPRGSSEKDSIVKKRIYDENIKNNYSIDYVLDDRDQVVAMWRSLGLTCLQVNYGNF